MLLVAGGFLMAPDGPGVVLILFEPCVSMGEWRSSGAVWSGHLTHGLDPRLRDVGQTWDVPPLHCEDCVLDFRVRQWIGLFDVGPHLVLSDVNDGFQSVE